MKRDLIILLLILPLLLPGITLQECLEKAEEQYAGKANQAIFSELQESSRKAAGSRYYPQLGISGSYNGQSESTAIDLAGIPFEIDFPEQSKTSYNLSLQLQQVIYDGGAIKNSKELSGLQYESRLKGVENELQERRLLVTSIFYQILLAQRQQEILNLYKENLTAELRKVTAGIDAGILEENSSLLVQEQLWQLAEEVFKVKYQEREFLAKLSRMTGLTLAEDSELENYEADLFYPSEIVSPGLSNLLLQAEMEKTQSRIAGAGLLPQLGLNGTYAWGNPGYDIFSKDAHTYYRGGINLNWQIWDWGSRRREKNIHQCLAEAFGNSYNAKKEAIELTLIEKDNDIKHLREELQLQDERIALLQQITENYESKLNEGMISTEDYLQQLNRLKEIELQQAATEISLSFQKIMKLFIMGGTL